jgi:hypothetical protein
MDVRPDSFLFRLEESERFHRGTGKVHETVRQLATDLDRAKIDYALVGAMALNAHGYTRETVDVDVLIRPDGLERFRNELVGLGYRPAFESARNSFRNSQTRVAVEFLTTGEYPGDGKHKPVAFPDPSKVAIEIDGIKVVDLPTLITLKLASGMTAPHRLRDLADVQDLARLLVLDTAYADRLDAFVRPTFLQLVQGLRSAGTEEIDHGHQPSA